MKTLFAFDASGSVSKVLLKKMQEKAKSRISEIDSSDLSFFAYDHRALDLAGYSLHDVLDTDLIGILGGGGTDIDLILAMAKNYDTVEIFCDSYFSTEMQFDNSNVKIHILEE